MSSDFTSSGLIRPWYRFKLRSRTWEKLSTRALASSTKALPADLRGIPPSGLTADADGRGSRSAHEICAIVRLTYGVISDTIEIHDPDVLLQENRAPVQSGERQRIREYRISCTAALVYFEQRARPSGSSGPARQSTGSPTGRSRRAAQHPDQRSIPSLLCLERGWSP